jgi:hypothetical protein
MRGVTGGTTLADIPLVNTSAALSPAAVRLYPLARSSCLMLPNQH